MTQSVSREMSTMGATQQAVLDLAPNPEQGLRTLTAMFEEGSPAHTAAKVFSAWHSAHRGHKLDVRVTGKEVSTHLFSGDSIPLLYVYPFYADHLPELFSEDVNWDMVCGKLENSPPFVPEEPIGTDSLEGVSTVMFSTNFKNHANHTWLQHLSYGHEGSILFLSPVPIQADETAVYYRSYSYLEASAGQCVTLLKECGKRGIRVVDLDCQTNDLTPSVIQSSKVGSIPLIGYRAPDIKSRFTPTTTVWEPSLLQHWSFSKGIIPPEQKPPKRMLINAAPIKWMSADMNGVRAALEAYDGPILFRKAKESHWYVKELQEALRGRTEYCDADYPRGTYAHMLQQCTSYLEISGRGTFSCIQDAVCAGLDVVVAPGERAYENKVLLQAMDILKGDEYPKPVTRAVFWNK